MMRVFQITLTTSYQNLFTLLEAVTGAVPTKGILPDKVGFLSFGFPASGEAVSVLIGDSNVVAGNTTGFLIPSTGFNIGPFDKNIIELNDYNLKAGTGGTLSVLIENN